MDVSLHHVYLRYIGLHSKCLCILLAYGRSDKLFMQEFHVNAYSNALLLFDYGFAM